MPTFIDMSNLAKRSTLTGNEEFQVSATEKVTSQQIADLAPAKEVKRVIVTDFQTNEWTLIGGVSVSFPNDIKEGEIVAFTNSKNATNGPGVGLFGYAIKCDSRMASYVGMTTDYTLNSIPTIYMYKSAGAYSTAWQQLPDETVIRLPGMDVELNPSDGAIIPYTSIELTKLSPGVTLMLCFEIADADGRFSPSGNVVVYFDLPPANNLWNAIAGFFDSATSFNGSINVRRRVAGVLDFQCTSALLDGYPGLQVYLRHIFVLR